MTDQDFLPRDPRLQHICEMLLQLASGNLEVRGTPSEQGDEIDAITAGVAMLAEELAASFRALHDSHTTLENRVRERTAELAEVNEQLRQELAERVRAEQNLRQAETQLLHAQKMEAVGRLAGGIAHDFNNMLTVINGLSAVLLAELRQDDPIREDLVEIRSAGGRAAALTQQLLAFSRRQIMQPSVLDPNEIVRGLEGMLRRLVGEHIELVTNLCPKVGNVRVDHGQIEQAIVNLAVNARDAMTNGGRLTLETARVECRPGGEPSIGLPPGSHVELRVSDTGMGMDPDTIARIFEPFFTTKGHGKGTGLGLSTVLGIVEQCGGTIRVSSELGSGTTFIVSLPETEEERKHPSKEEAEPNPVRAGETILVVEDNDQVRRVACGILERGGFRVLNAATPGEALLKCEQFAGVIDLLLSDVVMPQLNGPALAQRLIAMRPGLKVLFMSGYSDDAIMLPGDPTAPVAFLHKPFSPDQLKAMVRLVIDS